MTGAIHVRFVDGTVRQYETMQEATEDILSIFAETGRNLVDDVWDDEDNAYSVTWSLSIERTD